MHCSSHQSTLENPLVKKYRHNRRTDLNNIQINYRKNLILPKKKYIRAIFAIFSLCKFDANEARHMLTKSRKSINSWSNHFWNPIADLSQKLQYARTSTKNLIHTQKDLVSINDANMLTNKLKKNRSVSKFLQICLSKLWAPGARLKVLLYLKKLNFLHSSWAKNVIPTPAGSPTTKCSNGFHCYPSKKTTTRSGVKHPRTVNIEKKTWKWKIWIQM